VSPRLEEASEDTIETSDIPKVSSFCYSSSKLTAVAAAARSAAVTAAAS